MQHKQIPQLQIAHDSWSHINSQNGTGIKYSGGNRRFGRIGGNDSSIPCVYNNGSFNGSLDVSFIR